MLVTRRAQCLIWQNRNVSGHRVETLPPESTTNADLLRVLADALGLRSSAKPGTNVDWAELLGLAARGGVLSWFSHASEVENSAPEFAIETCKSERMRVAQRNILLAKELCRVSHLLAEREIPCITLPVRSGRDMANIVEVAALNQKLKELGHDAAKELDDKVISGLPLIIRISIRSVPMEEAQVALISSKSKTI